MSHTRELIDIELECVGELSGGHESHKRVDRYLTMSVWVSFQEVMSHTRELIDIELECVGELSGGHESHKRVDRY